MVKVRTICVKQEFEPLRYDIFREPYFFVLFQRDEKRADLKHLIIFFILPPRG